MHCLLLGNGFNRLAMHASWQQLLDNITKELGLAGQVVNHEGKPLSMLFEELCLRMPQYENTLDAERVVKKRIANSMDWFEPHPLLELLVAQFSVVLTTNYDSTIETALAGPLSTSRALLPESKYDMFRFSEVGMRQVWHVHGEAVRPQTMLLGYDHYVGYLQKIRNYLTNGVPPDGVNGQLRSPLRAGAQEFEKYHLPYSWVDHFLRDHLHIVGLGMDFTEIDLWWLLVYKRRRPTKTGKSFFYDIDIDGTLALKDPAKFSLFESLGVEVVSIPANNYADGYALVNEAVRKNIDGHKSWLPHTVKRRSPRRLDQAMEVGRIATTANEKNQLKLNLRRLK